MPSDVPTASPSSASRPAAGRTAWLVLGVLLLFSIAAPLNQFKVSPILPVLMQAFNLSVSQAGLLMSVYAVTGLLLALPAGFIFQKAGYRLTSLLAGGSIVLGAAFGAVSSGVGGLLVSRVIEGIGTSFMAVLAPAVIAVWFAAGKRGVAMGVWSNWVPLGSIIMLILAPLLTQQAGWQAVWWFGALYALVVTGLCLVFVKPQPTPAASAVSADAPAPASEAMGRVLHNGNLWLLSVVFALFNMASIAALTYLPTYLGEAHGVPLSQAAQIVSLSSVATIVSAPLAGILSDRIGDRKRPYLAGLVLTAVAMPLTVVFSHTALVVLIILQGVVASLVPTNVFSAAVEVVGDERLGGLAMGVIMFGQNAGMLAGPVIFGALAESAGEWPLAFGSLAVICLLAVLAGGAAKIQQR